MGRASSAVVSDDELEKLLYPFVSTGHWLAYGEDLAKSKIEKHLITPHAKLVKAMHDKEYMSLKQEQLCRVFGRILKMRTQGTKHGWPSDEKAAEWCEISARRLRCMLRHVSQAILQGRQSCKPASWLALIGVCECPSEEKLKSARRKPKHDKDEERPHKKSRLAEEVQKDQAKEQLYFYGFDHETKKGFRALKTKPRIREYAVSHIEHNNATPTTPMGCMFDDTSMVDIPGLTTEDWRAIQENSAHTGIVSYSRQTKLQKKLQKKPSSAATPCFAKPSSAQSSSAKPKASGERKRPT